MTELCPLTSREGHYLLTCTLTAGHDGDCWADTITTTEQTTETQ